MSVTNESKETNMAWNVKLFSQFAFINHLIHKTHKLNQNIFQTPGNC